MGAKQETNPLYQSFIDPNFLTNWPLNHENVLDYFSNKDNPFYDARCNNGILKMQNCPDLSNLTKMSGIEYGLIHYQDPILYIIQKRERRQNPGGGSSVTPLAHYHIIGGTVYQAPDLASIMNSRLSTSLDKILDSFQSCNSASRYNPTKGYWWEFKNHKVDTQKKKKEEENVSKIATQFQKNRVDVLLGKLMKSHPYMYFQRTQGQEPIKLNTKEPATKNGTDDRNGRSRKNPKSNEDSSQPLPKRQRMN